MREMKLPKFKSDEEEVEFWDSFDTVQFLEEGEEIKLEYKPEPEVKDICIQCGERMIERKRDIDMPGEEITIHIKEYYCPKCKKSRLGHAESKRLSEVVVGLLAARSEEVLEKSAEVYKDKEGYFVRIPVEIVQSLDIHEKKRIRIWRTGKRRIIVEI
jgi:Zn finger protein HypA/HybF involved in hydrogenase expression